MQLSLLGFILIIVGIIIIMIALFSFITSEDRLSELSKADNELAEEEQLVKREKTKKKFAGVIFIGPIPIIIASDKKTGLIAFIISLILFLTIIGLILYFGWV